MKRVFLVMTLCALLLSGCATVQYRTEKITFYYPRTEVLYGSETGVIAPEVRTLSGSLSALISVYLKGPESAELTAPCPFGTRLISTLWRGSALTISLSSEFTELEGIDLTVSCAAIAETCFSLSSATTVTITAHSETDAPDISMTLTPDALLFFDEISATENTTSTD